MATIAEENPTPRRDNKEYVGTSRRAALQLQLPEQGVSSNRSIDDEASHTRSGAPSTAVPTCFQHVTPQQVEMAAERLKMGGRGRMFPKPRRPRPSIKTTCSQSPCTVRALPSIPKFASGLYAARKETGGLSAKGEIFGPATPSRTKTLSRACLAQRVLPASTFPTDSVDDGVQTSSVSKRTTRAKQAR